MQRGEVADEPRRREPGDFLERARLLEEVGRAGHDRELLLAAQLGERRLVQLDDAVVVSADDEQRRRLDAAQRGRAREVRAPAARHHGHDVGREACGDLQRRRGTGARAEQSHREVSRARVVAHEAHAVGEPTRQELDLEAPLVVGVLARRQQVEEQRAESGRAERPCHERVARTLAARPAAVREQHDAERAFGHDQRAVERDVPGGDRHGSLHGRHRQASPSPAAAGVARRRIALTSSSSTWGNDP